MTYSFEQLIGDHRAILGEIEALSVVLDAAADTNKARNALTRLIGELAPHLAIEDDDIYPLLLASTDEGAASAARSAIRAFETLAGDWDHHAARWTTIAIARDRATFDAETRRLIALLGQRVQAENDLLYPLALRAAHIRLRT